MDARGRTGGRRGIPTDGAKYLVRALRSSHSADLRVTLRLTGGRTPNRREIDHAFLQRAQVIAQTCDRGLAIWPECRDRRFDRLRSAMRQAEPDRHYVTPHKGRSVARTPVTQLRYGAGVIECLERHFGGMVIR